MEILIINLVSSSKRKKFQQQQLAKLNLRYAFVIAISVNDIDNSTYEKHYYDWQRPLSKAEMACYFSHKKLWLKIIDNNQPALILEDDALLSKHTANVLKILTHHKNIDLVNLEVYARKKYVGKASKKLDNQHKLLRLYQNRAGAGAYVLYPTGAKKLLQHQQQKGIALADAFIHNCQALRSYQVEPALAVQSMFCVHYGIKQKNIAANQSIINITNIAEKHVFIFRIKRIITQIKLGFYKLGLLYKTNKRYIKLNKNHFNNV